MEYFQLPGCHFGWSCTADRMLHDRHSDLKVPTHRCHVV
jgi:hypothetical protein